VEGNPGHPVSRGAVCAAGQAALIGLYDADRARAARLDGRAATWSEIDAAVAAALDPSALGSRSVRVVVPWGLGPTEESALDLFLARHAARVVRFDPMGARDAMAQA